jgi:hypothetical protein
VWQNTGGALIYQSRVVQYFAFSISCDALPYTGGLSMNLEENIYPVVLKIKNDN